MISVHFNVWELPVVLKEHIRMIYLKKDRHGGVSWTWLYIGLVKIFEVLGCVEEVQQKSMWLYHLSVSFRGYVLFFVFVWNIRDELAFSVETITLLLGSRERVV